MVLKDLSKNLNSLNTGAHPPMFPTDVSLSFQPVFHILSTALPTGHCSSGTSACWFKLLAKQQ